VLRSIASRRGEKRERSTKVVEVVCNLLQGKVDKPFWGLAIEIDRPALGRCKVG
jgi:hypothetical protein